MIFALFRSSLRRYATAAFTFLLAASLLLALPPNAAYASTTVLHERFNALTVYASSDTLSSDGCVETYAEVEADRRTISYFTYGYDYCTDTVLYFRYGTGVPTTFKKTGNLASVHVVATTTLTDDLGGPDTEVSLNETWIATSPAVKTTDSYTLQLPGEYRSSYRVSATVREASVSGTIPFDSGFIGDFKFMTMSLTHS
jgi:hypothetical protein